MVQFSPIGDYKIVSAQSLSPLVRQLSLISDWYASIFQHTVRDTEKNEIITNWRSRLDAIKRFAGTVPSTARTSTIEGGIIAQEAYRDFTTSYWLVDKILLAFTFLCLGTLQEFGSPYQKKKQSTPFPNTVSVIFPLMHPHDSRPYAHTILIPCFFLNLSHSVPYTHASIILVLFVYVAEKPNANLCQYSCL